MQTMDDALFWSLIERLDWSREGDDEAVIEPLIHALTSLNERGIAAFRQTLTAKLYALDGRAWARESGEMTWWGDDSLSVDGFLYARCAVVANGRNFYETVLRDPTQMPKDLDFEPLLYVALQAFERKTGRDGDEIRDGGEVSYETFSNRAGWEPEP
jgi:hypothetical protein